MSTRKKNKTLPILLALPFVVSILAFYSVKALKNEQKVRPVSIAWQYKNKEAFIFDDSNSDFKGYKLEAKAILEDESYEDAPWNSLVWSVINPETETDPVAVVAKREDGYYLIPKKPGTCTVVCSDRDGTISRTFTAKISKNGGVIINNESGESGYSIESKHTYGQYDLVYDKLKKDRADKKPAKFRISSEVVLKDECINKTQVSNMSKNIDCKRLSDSTFEITCLNPGDAFIELQSVYQPALKDKYEFIVESNAYNINSYNDLMMVSNFSSNGLKGVLQTNLESMQNVYDESGQKRQGYNLFGNYDKSTKKYNFDNEVYRFTTTYNHEFIDQWNNKFPDNKKSPDVIAGVRLQKDLIGNGYKINMNALTYPTSGKLDSKGKLRPSEDDLFQGPLPFVSIGDMTSLSFVDAYGQDNCGIYLDGDNLKLKDLRISNTGEVDNMFNYAYTGSVVDVNGDNCVLEDCIIGNGKTAVRAFSTKNLLIDNCILKNAGEFLLKAGSNSYVKCDKSKTVEGTLGGTHFTKSFDEVYGTYEQPNAGLGCSMCLEYLFGKGSKETIAENLNNLQQGLDNGENVHFDGDITIKDTSFNNSGIFSIAFDSMFNGPFLYNGMPVTDYIEKLNAMNFHSISPNNIGGTSCPVNIDVIGNTNFYDWKDISKIDISCLIQENISLLINQMADKNVDISIDDYFPVKEILRKEAKKHGVVFKNGSKDYINSAVAWYGGGKNCSTIQFGNKEHSLNSESPLYNDYLNVDVFNASISGEYIPSEGGTIAKLGEALSKCVCLATGTNPFKFYTGKLVDGGAPLFGQTPHVTDLIKNKQGGNSYETK